VLSIHRQSLRVALTYALFGALWIIVSDQIVHAIWPTLEKNILAQTLKGFGFVGISSLLIYHLLRRELKEQQTVRQQLETAETNFAQLVEQLPVIVFQSMLTKAGQQQLEFLSANALARFPVPVSLLKPDRLSNFDFVHPEDLPSFLEERERSNSTQTPFEWRGRLLIGKEVRYIRMHSLPERLSGGAVRSRGIIEDETALVEARRTAEISQTRYQIALEATGGGLWDWNIASNEVAFSPALPEMLGYSPAEWGNTLAAWETRLHPEDVTVAKNAIKAHLSGEVSHYQSEIRMRCKDGSYKWLLDRGRIIERDTKGEPVRMIGLHIDIDAEKRRAAQVLQDEEKLRAIITNAPIGITVVDGSTNRFLLANPKFCEMIGRPESQLQALTWQELTYADDLASNIDIVTTVDQGKAQDVAFVKRFVRNDGKIIWASLTIHRLETFPEGHHTRLVMVRDITEVYQSEQKMRMFAAVIENTREGVIITDPEPKIISVNRAYTAITGYTAEEAIGKNPNIVSSGKQHTLFYAELWAELKRTGKWQGEILNRRKNGELYSQLSTIDAIYDEKGKVQYYIGVFSDISRLKKSQANFERLARYDILTGLPNRLMLTDRLNHAIETAKRGNQSLAVLFMDLDHFKNVNDSLGHEIGDELLINVAARLTKRLRAEDTVGRLGGDEFLILAENLQTANGAAILARDILTALSEPFALSTGHSIYTAGSIGISLYPQDGSTTAELVRNADAALYLAKSEGRNTFRFYTHELTATAKKRLELEAALRRAIIKKELSVVYQPIVNVASGEVIGAEALCRWFRDGGEQILPVEFIPVAEETGLIVPLGLFVLETACRQAAIWARKNKQFKTIAVNVSVRQFQDAAWQTEFAEILQSTGISPQLLEVEITESALMQKGAEAIAVLQQLKDTGVRVAIDDFGTGYSSLSYLQRFSVDTLKIDQSFVRELPLNSAAMQLVRTIIAMARNLGISTVAEGVEEEAQLQFLRAEGAAYYQGYHKSAAVSGADFTRDFL
jgi:diguanylate cyclase (GGDEF)-like protein/PAS domain S-box-containing protein